MNIELWKPLTRVVSDITEFRNLVEPHLSDTCVVDKQNTLFLTLRTSVTLTHIKASDYEKKLMDDQLDVDDLESFSEFVKWLDNVAHLVNAVCMTLEAEWRYASAYYSAVSQDVLITRRIDKIRGVLGTINTFGDRYRSALNLAKEELEAAELRAQDVADTE